jgi:hypothetical protein
MQEVNDQRSLRDLAREENKGQKQVCMSGKGSRLKGWMGKGTQRVNQPSGCVNVHS